MATPDAPPRGTLKLFHEDPYVLDFTARVVHCVPDGPGWLVTLDRTAFYATSGGQPHDLGFLRPGNGAPVPVSEVLDEEGLLRHRTAGPLEGEVAGTIDWGRRFDHMQNHTGQHVLSQAFIQVANAETVSFHLGTGTVTIDVAVPELSDARFVKVEDLANAVVQKDLPVRIHWTTREEIGRFPLRKPPVVDGAIRIVEIEGFDFSACGGTHVARTGEIGLIKILRRERYKGGLRVEFLCGGRALADYRAKHDMLRGIAEKSSIQDREVGDLVERLSSDAAGLRKRLRESEEVRLDFEADRLAASATGAPGCRLVHAIRNGDSPEDLKLLALKLRARPGLVALLGSAAPDGRAHLVFSRSDDVDADVAAILRAVLPVVDGRGGGRPEMAQGSGPKAEALTEALEKAATLVGDRAAGLA